MLKKELILALAMFLCITIYSCGPRKTVETHREFIDLDYSIALHECSEKVVKGYEKKDIGYPIYLLNHGALAQYVGELDSARASFWSAYRIDEGEIPEFTKGVEWLKADQKRVYQLTKRESELLHFFLGKNYLMSGHPAEAIVEFKKIELIDQNVSILPIVNFYSGKCYEILEKYDDARIEYDKLLSITTADRSSFVYLARAQVEFSLANYDDAYSFFDAYSSDVRQAYNKQEAEQIIGQIGWSNLIIQVDHQFSQTLGTAEAWIDDEYWGRVWTFDCFDVMVSGGEKSREVVKEVGSYVARKTTRKGAVELAGSIIPGLGCIGGISTDLVLGSDEEDKETRFWNYAPVGFSLIMLPIRDAAHSLKLVFYDHDGEKIGSKLFDLQSRNVFRISANILVNPCLDTPFYVY